MDGQEKESTDVPQENAEGDRPPVPPMPPQSAGINMVIDINAQAPETVPAMTPHKYPAWIIIFAFTICALLLYSLIFTPKYFIAAKKLRAAQAALKAHDYDHAITLYREVLDSVPSSKQARIGAAEAIFLNTDKDDDVDGLALLEGVKLNETERFHLRGLMPSKYWKYFDEVH